MKRKVNTRTVTRLRKLRRDREWTQAYVGGLVGVEGATISMYESGDVTPSVPVLLKLAKAFDCPAEELLESVEIPA